MCKIWNILGLLGMLRIPKLISMQTHKPFPGIRDHLSLILRLYWIVVHFQLILTNIGLPNFQNCQNFIETILHIESSAFFATKRYVNMILGCWLATVHIVKFVLFFVWFREVPVPLLVDVHKSKQCCFRRCKTNTFSIESVRSSLSTVFGLLCLN